MTITQVYQEVQQAQSLLGSVEPLDEKEETALVAVANYLSLAEEVLFKLGNRRDPTG